MYKKNIFSLILVLSVMAAGPGCKKDPTLVSPKDQYSTGNYPATLDDLNSVLASCYSNLRDQYLYGFDFLTKIMANASHASDAAYSDPDWSGFISTNTMAPQNGFVSGVWQA